MVKNAAPKTERYALSDGRGLLLEVHPNGSKYWIARVYDNKKEYRRSLGSYPEINLKTARDKAFELKRARNYKIDTDRQTFGDLFQKFHTDRLAGLSDSYLKTVNLRWKKYLEPEFSKFRVKDITPSMVLNLCQGIIDDGYIDTAHRIRMLISQVFEYAIVSDFVTLNPAASIGKSKMLKTALQLNYAAITDTTQIGQLIRNIYAYPHMIVKYAMLLSAHTFCRPVEIRKAEWSEFNFEKKLWVIPAKKMKKRRDHVVPLSSQVLNILESLSKETGKNKWLFPSSRADGRSMSDGTVRVALRSMGYEKDEMTAHGFRSTASTVLNNFQWPEDAIEVQLSHKDSTIRGVYNRNLYLSQRIMMMQWWSDTLDALRDKKKVPKIPKNIIS